MKKRKTQIPTKKAEKISNDLEPNSLEGFFGPNAPHQIQMMSKSLSYSGPLPPAEQFKVYEESNPGTGDKIIEYMNKEQAHRQLMEEKMVSASIEEAKTGQMLGYTVTIALIVSACLAIENEQPLLAAGFLGTSVLGLVKKFIDGRSQSSKQSEEK